MHLRERLATGNPLFSFEFFPPKTDAGVENLRETIADLGALEPAFVSVTYGAGGSTQSRTLQLVRDIQREQGLSTMAHLTCVGSSRAQIADILDRLREGGVRNIIALRGDPPAGSETFEAPKDGFAYASELIRFIRAEHGDYFCVAAACYPEAHVECRDLSTDIQHLAKKVAEGVDFLVTQLFFDNRYYFEFVEKARDAGIDLPIVPGIMPIGNAAQIERFTKMCGATIPAKLHAEMNRWRDDLESTQMLGVAHATAQCVDLLENGAPGLHFYTLNKSKATRLIFTGLANTVLSK